MRPTAVTSPIRRTRMGSPFIVDGIPPGSRDASVGTVRTARGKPRGEAATDSADAESP